MRPFRPNWMSTFTLTIAMLISAPAFADIQDDTDRLFDALEALSEGAVDQRDGDRQWYVQNAIRTATNRVRVVRLNLRYNRYQNSRVSEAIDIAYDKLTDNYLYQEDKIEYGLDCIAIALREIIEDTMYREVKVKKLLTVAKLTAVGHMHSIAKDTLQDVLTALRYGSINCPITTRGVRDVVNFAIRKLSDHSLSDYQKEAYALNRIEAAFDRLADGGF